MRTNNKRIFKANLYHLGDRLAHTTEKLNDRVTDRVRTAMDSLIDADFQRKSLLESAGKLRAMEHIHSLPSRADIDSLPEDLRELNLFWSQLSRAEKDEVYRSDPFVGNRDGIAHVDRDQYNRQTLLALKERSTAANDTALVDNYSAIEKNLESPGESPRYLSYFDGYKRVAMAIENPDTAHNVFTFVDGIGRDPLLTVDKAERARQVAIRLMGHEAKVSGIMWYAHERPTSLIDLLNPAYAHKGGRQVERFQEGLRATHRGPMPLSLWAVSL
jgi:hypothetical protein